MIYKGYRILGTQRANDFFNLNEDGEALDQVPSDEINYSYMEDPMWYSVIDESNWVVQSFDTIEEAKEYIEEQE